MVAQLNLDILECIALETVKSGGMDAIEKFILSGQQPLNLVLKWFKTCQTIEFGNLDVKFCLIVHKNADIFHVSYKSPFLHLFKKASFSEAVPQLKIIDKKYMYDFKAELNYDSTEMRDLKACKTITSLTVAIETYNWRNCILSSIPDTVETLGFVMEKNHSLYSLKWKQLPFVKKFNISGYGFMGVSSFIKECLPQLETIEIVTIYDCNNSLFHPNSEKWCYSMLNANNCKKEFKHIIDKNIQGTIKYIFHGKKCFEMATVIFAHSAPGIKNLEHKWQLTDSLSFTVSFSQN